MAFGKFIPTDEQRNMVALLANLCVTQEAIAKIIINPNTGKPINKVTLEAKFRPELENGKIQLQHEIISQFAKAVREGQPWAIKHGMTFICGIGGEGNKVAIGINTGDPNSGDHPGILVQFKAPDGSVVEEVPVRDEWKPAPTWPNSAQSSEPRRLPPPPDNPAYRGDLPSHVPQRAENDPRYDWLHRPLHPHRHGVHNPPDGTAVEINRDTRSTASVYGLQRATGRKPGSGGWMK